MSQIKALERCAAESLEKPLAEKFCAQLGLEFHAKPNYHLPQYVLEAWQQYETPGSRPSNESP